MDRIGQEALLFDFYGQLLTEKQIQVLDMHLNNDLSLGEIAVELQISRQGVHDTVKRSVKALEEYEDRLGLVKRYLIQKNTLLDIKRKIDRLKILHSEDEHFVHGLDEIGIELEKLL